MELEHSKRGDNEPTWNYRPERDAAFDLAEGLDDYDDDGGLAPAWEVK